MVVIYKWETIQSALEQSLLRRAQYGSKRNVQQKQCSKCFISFETLKRYPRQICMLCRYEDSSHDYKEKCLSNYDDEKEFYAYHLQRGIDLQRKKERFMKAKGVTLKRVLSPRLESFSHLLDKN